uniref:Uncharacterized protein n=1 Tax=Zooxanthella nutricula TaxID=1333877 RepID=A0A6U6MHX2_9DINO
MRKRALGRCQSPVAASAWAVQLSPLASVLWQATRPEPRLFNVSLARPSRSNAEISHMHGGNKNANSEACVYNALYPRILTLANRRQRGASHAHGDFTLSGANVLFLDPGRSHRPLNTTLVSRL